MKRTLIFLAMSAFILGWSCSRIEENAFPENPSSGTKMMITATVGEHFTGAPSDTKTALQPADENNKRAIWWTPGDAINIFYGSMSSSKFETDITEAQPIAPFYGNLGAATGASDVGINTQTFWGVYPYDKYNSCDGDGVTLRIPGEQLGVPGGFADKLNPTVANSPGLGLSFYNVGSWFIFTVSQSGITSLTFRGNNDEDIAGKVRVTMDSDGKPVSEIKEGIKSITITPEAGGSFVVGEEYRIVLVPQTLSGGITLTMRKGEQTATLKLTSSLTFKRSSYLRKKEADKGLTWEDMFVEMAPGFFWAKMNFGAFAPEDYGDYFAWGETSTKSSYTDNNYHYIQPFYDVATFRLGENWRTPTSTEWEALGDTANYTWEWTTENGVNGVRVISKVTGYVGNSIFLPAAGYKMSTYTYNNGEYGSYWSSTLDGTDSRCAVKFSFGSNYHSAYGLEVDRYYGFSVRPLYDPSSVSPVSPEVPVTGVSFDADKYAVVDKGTSALTVTITPEDATIQDLTWVSSNPSVAIVSPTGVVTGKSVGTTTITVRTVDGGYRAACTVTVIPNASYVDMGDGTKWATMNVGADSPEEYGGYYAWGETSPKSSFSWNNYKWGTQTSFTKYVTKSSLGTVDNLTTLQSEDDAATVNLGDNWRTPTRVEWEWLENNCTWTEMTMNGIKGYLVTSNVPGFLGNSIFLPAGGAIFSSPQGVGIDGRFWSSTLDADSDGAYSYYIYPANTQHQESDEWRYPGLMVRPIYEPHQFINGHEYVEMGDGLKWATCNVGADAPEAYGTYFAWGETTPKNGSQGWGGYFDNPSGDGETFTKYAMDKKTQLDLEDDAARVNWGGTWRMPTYAEWNALLNSTNFDWERDDVKKGYKVTSKVSGYEGNSIFLPAAGFRNPYISSVGYEGRYRSSSLSTRNSQNAWSLMFVCSVSYQDCGLSSAGDRWLGYPVRAVSD